MSNEAQQPKNEQVTHWKKLTNPAYVSSCDFQPNQEITVTIDKVATEMVKGSDGKSSSCLVMSFIGGKKPMILNKTNAKIVTRVLGTPYIEQWNGKKIILYVAKVNAFGEEVDAIRVKNQKPA
jgi:hypothetical protein